MRERTIRHGSHVAFAGCHDRFRPSGVHAQIGLPLWRAASCLRAGAGGAAAPCAASAQRAQRPADRAGRGSPEVGPSGRFRRAVPHSSVVGKRGFRRGSEKLNRVGVDSGDLAGVGPKWTTTITTVLTAERSRTCFPAQLQGYVCPACENAAFWRSFSRCRPPGRVARSAQRVRRVDTTTSLPGSAASAVHASAWRAWIRAACPAG